MEMLKPLFIRSKEDIKQLFNERVKKTYKKNGRYLARSAIPGETVLTIVSGRLETLKRAEKDEWVVRNIELGGSAETYIIDSKKFNERYDIVKECSPPSPFPEIVTCSYPVLHTIDRVSWTEITAKGRCEAFEWHGDRIAFIAPWGEPMECLEGDYLARPLPGAVDDIYRIERATFLQTYTMESE